MKLSTILDKIDDKFRAPCSPNQGWENGASWLSRGFILDFRGMEFTVPFYSVLDCSCKECENRLIWFCQSAFLKSK